MAEHAAERRAAGELETSVLAALWAANGPQTAGQVQRSLTVELARTTVTTALTRLHAKGAVGRERSGRGFAYYPVRDAHGLTAQRMHHELDKDHDRHSVLARFVSDLDPEDERILRDLLGNGDGQ